MAKKQLLRWGVVLGAASTLACALPIFTDIRDPERPRATLKATCWSCKTHPVMVVDLSDNSLVWEFTGGASTSTLHLRPGTYLITYTAAKSRIGFTRDDVVELLGGQVYRIRTKFCGSLHFFGSCRGRVGTGTAWIEEESTGRVVAGERWDGPTPARSKQERQSK